MKNFPIKTVAACAVTALAVGTTTATAASMITSSAIKDGAVHMRDLAPGVQAKLRHAVESKGGAPGMPGTPGANGTNGTNGAKGADGANGLNGTNGTNGTNGLDGKDGRDGVRYDRIVGSCDDGVEGEIAIADGAAQLGVPTQNAWAQVRSYPKNLKVSQLDTLSFKANASDEGVTYLKVTTTGHGSIVFSPNTQPGGEQTGTPVSYDVLDGTSRWNDDAGFEGDMSWDAIAEKAGDRHVKTISVVAGCALPVGADGAQVSVDDITINDEVIDFA